MAAGTYDELRFFDPSGSYISLELADITVPGPAIAVQLSRGVSISGTVTAVDDGAPLANIEVMARRSPPPTEATRSAV